MNKIKTVIVTGATRGIGLAITKTLLRRGFAVHMIAKNIQGLKRVRTKLSKYGEVTYSVVNLALREEIDRFCLNWNKRIWGIVNNAGRWAEERIDEPSKNIWDPIMRLNIDGVYFLTKGLQKWIISGGRIVNISSQLGTSGRAGMGAYTASKYAVIGLTKCWALELGIRGITVNAVCPGWVETYSNKVEIQQWAKETGISYASKKKEISQQLTLQRFIKPDEVANLVTFLIEPGGSGVTGQIHEIK